MFIKALRIFWVVIAAIIVLPFIVAFEIIYLPYFIYTAIKLGCTIKCAVKYWLELIKYGLKIGMEINIDFIKNGL